MRSTVATLVFSGFVLVASHGQQVLPISIGNAGHIIVSASVNDTVGTFILDTGAGIHVLAPRFLKRIVPTPVHAGLFTGFRHDGDRLDTELLRAQFLNVGDQSQAEPVFGIYPPLEQWGIDGLISMKFFEGRACTIDFGRKQLRFESDSSLAAIADRAESIGLEFHADRDVMLDIFVRLIVQDSVQALAEFDTGAGFETVLLNPQLLGRLGIDSAHVKAETRSTQSGLGTRMVVTAQVGSLQYAGSVSTRQSGSPATFKEGLIYEGLIGSGAFREKRLTLDAPNKRMLVW